MRSINKEEVMDKNVQSKKQIKARVMAFILLGLMIFGVVAGALAFILA